MSGTKRSKTEFVDNSDRTDVGTKNNISNGRCTVKCFDKIKKKNTKEDITLVVQSSEEKSHYFTNKEKQSIVNFNDTDDFIDKKVNKIPPKKVNEKKVRKPSNRNKRSDDFEKVCYSKGIDIDPDNLQLAVALSKSLSNADEVCSEECEFASKTTSNTNISKIAKTLQRFGFEIKPHTSKSYKNNISNFPLIKKSHDEKNLIVSNIISSILFENSDGQVDHCTYKSYDFSSNFLKNAVCEENCIFSKCGLSNTNSEISMYYICNLVEPESCKIGSLLKQWSSIPGREKTPEKNICNDIKMKFLNIGVDLLLSGTQKCINDSVNSRSPVENLSETESSFHENYIVDQNVSTEYMIDLDANRSNSPDIFDDISYIIESKKDIDEIQNINEAMEKDINEDETEVIEINDDENISPTEGPNHEIIAYESHRRLFDFTETEKIYDDFSDHELDEKFSIGVEKNEHDNEANNCNEYELSNFKSSNNENNLSNEHNFSAEEMEKDINGDETEVIEINDDENVSLTEGPNHEIISYENHHRLFDFTETEKKFDFSDHELDVEKNEYSNKVNNFNENELSNFKISENENNFSTEHNFSAEGLSSNYNDQSSENIESNKSLDTDDVFVISDDEVEYSMNMSHNIKSKYLSFSSRTPFSDLSVNIPTTSNEFFKKSHIDEEIEEVNNSKSPEENMQNDFSVGNGKGDSTKMYKSSILDPIYSDTDLSLHRHSTVENVHNNSHNSFINTNGKLETQKIQVNANIETMKNKQFLNKNIQLGIPNVTTPKGTKYIIKTDNVTPKTDYNSLNSPEILQELSKYGIRPLKRKRAVQILDHIYEQTHPVVDFDSFKALSKRAKIDKNHDKFEGELKNDTIARHKDNEDSNYLCTDEISSNPDNKHNISEYQPDCEFITISNIECDSSEWIFQSREKSKVHSCRVPLHIVFYNYISRRSKLKNDILKYEPVDIDIIHNNLKSVGYRFKVKDLITFMDKKCIAVKLNNKESQNRRKNKTKKS